MPSSFVFDAFGTLLKINEGKHPYRQLLKVGMKQGRRPKPDDIHHIMCQDWSLRDTAEAFGIDAPEATLIELEELLREEVAGIEAYPDAIEAVELLKSHGRKVAVCSNLGQPYGEAIKRCFPGLDGYLFSYEVGAMKPDPAIYAGCCIALQCEPEGVAMIGDSQTCDRDGPHAFGMAGYYLDRHHGKGDYADLLSFARGMLARQ